MRFQGIGAAVLAVAIAVAPGARAEGFFGGGPLERLAERVPLTALQGELMLVDMAAARAEVVPLFPGADAADRWLAVLSAAPPPPQFAPEMLTLPPLPEGMGDLLGFDTDAIGQIAGWGWPPESNLVIRVEGGADPARIGAALEGRGFDVQDLGGTPVWHRLRDFELDLVLRAEDPITGMIGQSTRIAVRDGDVVSSRDWMSMKFHLGGGPWATADREFSALMEAARAGGPGRLVWVYLPSEPMMAVDPGELLEGRVPEAPELLPRYGRYAILSYRDGWVAGGAVAMVYRDVASAEAALALAVEKLGTVHDPYVQKPYAEVFRTAPRTEVVAAGGWHVAMLSFEWDLREMEQPGGTGLGPIALMNGPQRRFLDMYMNRALGPLLAWQ